MKAPAFQLYASDIYMDTVEWTVEEVGIYNRLLHTQWVNGSLPNDISRLARIAGCGSKRFQKGWGLISFKFFLTEDGRLQNLRLEETRQKQIKYRELQLKKSKLGVQARKKQQPTGEPTDKPTDQPDGKPLQSSSSTLKKKDIYVLHHGDEKVLLKDGVEEVLRVLNEEREKILGRKLRPVTSDANIIARLKEKGKSVHMACRIVITKAGDKYFRDNPKYLHPDTLFQASKWKKYLEEADLERA